MSRFVRFVCIGVFLFGSFSNVTWAEEMDKINENPEPQASIQKNIPQANKDLVSSFRELKPDYWQESPLPIQGLAMYYNPGVMERVLKNRRGWGHVTECKECIGRVALLRDGDVDRRVWLQRPGYPVEGPFWVIDQAAQRDVPGLVRRNWAVDVDYQTAMRWRMRGPIPIIVLDDPSQSLPVGQAVNTETFAQTIP
jgi:hypothetical protein